MNKITKSFYPEIFSGIKDLIIDHTSDEDSGDAVCYCESIIEIKSEYKSFFPKLEDFDKLVGFWKTNTYMRDSRYTDYNAIDTLTRVYLCVRLIEEEYWSEKPMFIKTEGRQPNP